MKLGGYYQHLLFLSNILDLSLIDRKKKLILECYHILGWSNLSQVNYKKEKRRMIQSQP